MARALMIDDQVRTTIADLIAKARERPTRFEDLQRMADARQRGVTINPLNNDLTMTIPHGFRVTYTEEYQRADVRCRHMSVSLINAGPRAGPHPAAVSVLMEEFGFVSKLGECPLWTSDDNGRLIIEVLEPLDGNMDHLKGGNDA